MIACPPANCSTCAGGPRGYRSLPAWPSQVADDLSLPRRDNLAIGAPSSATKVRLPRPMSRRQPCTTTRKVRCFDLDGSTSEYKPFRRNNALDALVYGSRMDQIRSKNGGGRVRRILVLSRPPVSA